MFVVSVVASMLAACQQTASPAVSSPRASATPTALAACPLGSPPPARQVMLTNRAAPDDLAFDNQGRLLFSDIIAGSVFALNADGSVQTVASGLSLPEGIVVQADDRILVAEQGRNRIVAIDPRTHAITVWRTFTNRTSNEGIDGIGPILPAKDASGQALPNADDVVVPDSPNGVVWLVGPDGKGATQLAGGMTRPVGAARDTVGRILVADEGGALWSLDPATHRLASLPTPDDVVVTQDGHLFVNTLGDNAIHELDAQGRAIRVLAGIAQPQGIALDSADNLYYTVATGGRIERAVRTFILDPPRVTRVADKTFLICPTIRRVAGFTQPLALSTGSSLHTTILELVQPGVGSSGALEVQTSEPSVTIGVNPVGGGENVTLSQTVTLSP